MLHGIPSQKMVFFFYILFFEVFVYMSEIVVCDFLLMI